MSVIFGSSILYKPRDEVIQLCVKPSCFVPTTDKKAHSEPYQKPSLTVCTAELGGRGLVGRVRCADR